VHQVAGVLNWRFLPSFPQLVQDFSQFKRAALLRSVSRFLLEFISFAACFSWSGVSLDDLLLWGTTSVRLALFATPRSSYASLRDRLQRSYICRFFLTLAIRERAENCICATSVLSFIYA
jgi:hypothetical protein